MQVEVLYGLKVDPTGRKYTARGRLRQAVEKSKDWITLLDAMVEGHTDLQKRLFIPIDNIVHVVELN